MIYTLALKDQTKEKYLSELKTFLKDDVKYQELYDKFGYPNLREVHPFALIQQAINTRTKAANVFPSVSIAITTENLKPQNFLGRKTSEGLFTQAHLDAYKNIDVEKRLYSKTTITTLQNNINTNVLMRGYTYNNLETGSIVISVWDDNDRSQDALYQMVKLFNEVKGEEVFLSENWEELSWQAERDGLYNFDIGRPLYGSMITVTGTRKVENMTVSTTEPIQGSQVGITDPAFSDITAPIQDLNTNETYPNGAKYDPA